MGVLVVVFVGDGDALEGGLEVGDVHGVCVRCGAGLCCAARGEKECTTSKSTASDAEAMQTAIKYKHCLLCCVRGP